MNVWTWVCAGVLLVGLGLPLAAQDKPAEMVIRATGKGYPKEGQPAAIGKRMAERAAKIVALRNLLKTIAELVPESQGDSRWLEGHLKGYKVVKTTPIDKGGFEVTVEMPVSSLAGSIRVLYVERERLRRENDALKKQLEEARSDLEALRERFKTAVAGMKALLDKLK